MRTTRTLLLSLLAVLAIGAVASASASAFSLEWEVPGCVEGTATIKFETSTCEKVLSTGKWTETGALEKLAAGKKRLVTSKIKSATFVLKAAGITVTCKSADDTGTITGGKPGTDETTILFDECTTNIAGCKVKSAPVTKPEQAAGNILVENIPTKLVEGETKAGVKVIAEEFAENATRKAFVTLEFGEVEKVEIGPPEKRTLEKACPGIASPTKVKGKIFAIVTNIAGGKIMLTFPPKAELLKTPVNTLNVFGLAAELIGEEEVSLVGGGELKAV